VTAIPHAITAGTERRARGQEWDKWWTDSLTGDIQSTIQSIVREAFFAGWEAAVPLIAAAERDRMRPSVEDAVEQALTPRFTAIAEAAKAAERDRIIQLALDLDAQAWSNRGPMAKRVAFAGIIREAT
jgi:hypothetical protein